MHDPHADSALEPGRPPVVLRFPALSRKDAATSPFMAVARQERLVGRPCRSRAPRTVPPPRVKGASGATRPACDLPALLRSPKELRVAAALVGTAFEEDIVLLVTATAISLASAQLDTGVEPVLDAWWDSRSWPSTTSRGPTAARSGSGSAAAVVAEAFAYASISVPGKYGWSQIGIASAPSRKPTAHAVKVGISSTVAAVEMSSVQ